MEGKKTYLLIYHAPNRCQDCVAEWLRRLAANEVGSPAQVRVLPPSIYFLFCQKKPNKKKREILFRLSFFLPCRGGRGIVVFARHLSLWNFSLSQPYGGIDRATKSRPVAAPSTDYNERGGGTVSNDSRDRRLARGGLKVFLMPCGG
jgi:hypothetical protein